MNKLPVLITRGTFLFPKVQHSIEIGREKSIAVLAESTKTHNNKILIISQHNPLEDDPDLKDVFTVGVVATFSTKKVWKDNTQSILVSPEDRVTIKNLAYEGGLLYAEYDVVPTEKGNKETALDMFKVIKDAAVGVADFPENIDMLLEDEKIASDPNVLVDSIAQVISFIGVSKRQELLEEFDPIKRMEIITKLLIEKKSTSEIDTDITKKIKSNVDEQQREYYLREKLKVIKEELGDLDGEVNELNAYKKRLEEEPFPEHIKKRLLKEISKLEGMHASSQEANVLRNYIDWMMDIPWYERSDDNFDLEHAQKVLDGDHFGLEKVKERIIEYLAVRKNTQSVKGQIITLVGPPGVGKTSLAKSIAKAMNREYVKVSLGGIRDDAEIRGHRKTYVAAMPGRIIRGMKKAKVLNPLFLLDEIDKMGSDQKGDPTAAMLEVLDPEQNSQFSDHFIEEEYNLSNVAFIATANYPGDIPEALYDRMDIIQLSSYTEIEKIEIAKNHLIPKALKEFNITTKELKFKKEAIEEMVKYYTREAGVRQLERLIAAVARKFIVKKLKNELTEMTVTPEVINDLLKKRIFEHSKQAEKSEAGVVTGLAYTQYGGDILPIEVTHFPGKGGLVLTGKLGDVMKESATIAYDFVKANYKRFQIPKEVFQQNDVHIHVPEGAVPKDGPSAGIAITTAIISSLTNQKVSREIGMTGEVTLRGLVLPIGGLKEKSIAAHRSGLKTIVIPSQNEKDLDEIPQIVKDNLEIKFAKKYEEVYEIVFGTKISEYTTELPMFKKKEGTKQTTN
ncbi:endopeptidase La [Spiroplasma endosymbiont of Othius punctulatus]|uniref:endopeptidase La n=1 Tax=Spiroplasma endosymbiont of Othius punctulatus TaxID=3066289 RepID=UPI0030D28AC5